MPQHPSRKSGASNEGPSSPPRHAREGRGSGPGPNKGHRPPRPSRPRVRRAPEPGQLAEVVVNKRGVERWKKQIPWIYESDVVELPKLEGGEVVRVIDERGWFLGQAFYSLHSKITLRALSYDDRPIDAAFFAERIAQADELRKRALPGETAYRVIHGEADRLPGLVVDRYGDYLSVQFLVRGTDSRKEMLADLLMKHFGAKGLMERSDVNVRKMEGLEPQKGVLRGDVPKTITYPEGHVLFEADLLEGQKTGAFLDQRENHVLSSQYAFGEALDCFSYVGGFALQLATKADKVTAVEISADACRHIRANAERNKITNVEVVEANAFDFLRDAVDEGRKFDTVVIDPPSFAKNKDAIESALRGYKEVNLRALQMLRPGGILISASCTYHIDEASFEDMLAAAAADAGRRVQIIERRGAGRDHPVLLSLRETRYLKCFVMRVW